MVSTVDNALECSAYWKWLYDQFHDKKILTAKPTTLAAFTKDEAKEKRKIKDKNKSAAVDTICEKLFNYDDFRNYRLLLKPDVNGQKGRIQWISVCGDNSSKVNNEIKANREEWNGWNIAEFVRLLDIRYCPYCNAETVGTAMLPGRIHLPDIDHIFSKNNYPLLALSLYNLVPACNRKDSK